MPELPEIDPETKTALIRKGNEHFNRGDLDLAERIFLTVRYSDGLKRLAEYHFRRLKNVKKALDLYRQAGGREEEAMYELIAMGIKRLLADDPPPSKSAGL